MRLGARVHATLDAWVKGIAKFWRNVVEESWDRFLTGLAWRLERSISQTSDPGTQVLIRQGLQPEMIQSLVAESSRLPPLYRIWALIMIWKGTITRVMDDIIQVGTIKITQNWLARVRPQVAAVQEAVDCYFKGKLTLNEVRSLASRWGFPDHELQTIIWARESPVPAGEAISGWLRGLLTDNTLSLKLRSLGFSETDIPLLKQLAFYIPPPPDLIRMAVREVFTPAIAERFGQFQDFPPEFAKYARQQGISLEWARNYWAAHWELPSPQMGFEMLHRGVITQADLEMLLRAADVMPFWRDKIIKISYNPFTRVDVRRMFADGVITKDQVKRAYKDIGYDDWHADKLTEWTEKEYVKEEKDLVKADILDAFKRQAISEDKTKEYLTSLGYSDFEVDIFIGKVLYQRNQEKKKQVVTNSKALFKKGVISENDVLTRLAAVQVPDPEIREYIEIWREEKKEDVTVPTTAQLITFFKAEILSEVELREELHNQGYAEKYINAFVQLSKVVKE